MSRDLRTRLDRLEKRREAVRLAEGFTPAEADALMAAAEAEFQSTGQVRATFLPSCPLSRERQAAVIVAGMRISPSAVIWDDL